MGRIINNDEHYSAEKSSVWQNGSEHICVTNKRFSHTHTHTHTHTQTIRQNAVISCSPTDPSCISVKLLKLPRLPAPLTHPQVLDLHEESERKIKRKYWATTLK